MQLRRMVPPNPLRYAVRELGRSSPMRRRVQRERVSVSSAALRGTESEVDDACCTSSTFSRSASTTSMGVRDPFMTEH
jgi:hypothetical protein